MRARDYNAQFEIVAFWDRPGKEYAGEFLDYLPPDKGDGGGAPIWKIRRTTGELVRIVGHQERLKALMVEARPVAGDKVRVTYLGEASKAAPGFSPTKEFTVEVWPKKGSQSQARPEAELGEVVSENESGTGGKKQNG